QILTDLLPKFIKTLVHIQARNAGTEIRCRIWGEIANAKPDVLTGSRKVQGIGIEKVVPGVIRHEGRPNDSAGGCVDFEHHRCVQGVVIRDRLSTWRRVKIKAQSHRICAIYCRVRNLVADDESLGLVLRQPDRWCSAFLQRNACDLEEGRRLLY